MKLMIVVPSMRGGGAERVILTLLQNIDRNKFDITLVLVKKEGRYLAFIPNDIKIIDLNLSSAKRSIFKIAHIIRKNKPDIVFSTLGYMNLLLSIVKLIVPKSILFIARESSIVSNNLIQQEKFTVLFNFLYRYFYSRLDIVICQSEYMKQDLINNFDLSEKKIRVINNPVNFQVIQDESNFDNRMSLLYKTGINVLSVGGLSKVKGFDKLIQASTLLESNYHLTIMGEGKEENNLINLVKKLGLEDRVTFIGFKNNPYKYMRQADVLVLSSKYEGFPNVLLEANVCGTPVVAFNCPGGVAEIIENGVNGFLVENQNIEKLASTIIDAVHFDFDSLIIKQLAYERYEAQQQVSKYENIFYEMKFCKKKLDKNAS
tara:strand:- start:1586 stop:2707 length:1122 start_codon:yes stop_codon:yes gene_type:complete